MTIEERGYNYPLFCYIRRRLDRKKEEKERGMKEK